MFETISASSAIHGSISSSRRCFAPRSSTIVSITSVAPPSVSASIAPARISVPASALALAAALRELSQRPGPRW